MINVESKRTTNGLAIKVEIYGRSNCIFYELRSLIAECLSDEKTAEMFTKALSKELRKVKQHD